MTTTETETSEIETTPTEIDTGSSSTPMDLGRTTPAVWWWIVSGALVVALIGVGAWGVSAHNDRRDAVTRTAEVAAVQKAAADGAVRILSYKPQTVEADLAGAKQLLTGDFLDYYSRFTAEVVIPGSKQKQIATSATVPAAGVQSLTGDDAVVVVMVNQQTTSADNPQPAQSASSVRVQLTKKSGTWLIDKFDPI